MIHIVEKTIATHGLLDPATPAILMVSGGSDSTALAYLMKDLHERGQVGLLAMLHVNHKLRGQDAEDDAAFVSKLAQALDIPFFCCEVDVAALAEREGGNVEAIGRQERYIAAQEALESLCRHAMVPISQGRIVVAHTQDDRVENFYMRSIKGTGPGGFRSMRYANGPVVRPLMDVSRRQLRAYLAERAQSDAPVVRDESGALWREDATNAHTDRFRAYVRHKMVPVALEQNANLYDTLTRTMNLIADEDDYLNQVARDVAQAQVEWVNPEAMAAGEGPDAALLQPEFGKTNVAVARRVVLAVLQQFLGNEARIDAATVEAVLAAYGPEGQPVSGHVDNIQGDLAVSANKRGVLIEPMARYRARRKREGKKADRQDERKA